MNSKYLSILLSALLLLQIGIVPQVHAANLYNNKIEIVKKQKFTKEQIANLIDENDTLLKISQFKEVLNMCSHNNYTLNVNEIDAICNNAIKCLKEESCLLKIDGSTIIVGDIHGDIKAFEFCARKFLRELDSGKSILFLGDYVDRGKNSVECAALILLLKVIFPNKVFLLRGNHEDAKMSHKYGFEKEALKKYDNDRHVFEKIHEAFNYLSIAAIIDNSTLCVHGGISLRLNDLRQIDKLQKPIPYTNLKKGNFVMDLLWSDPSSDAKDFKEDQNLKTRKKFSHEQTKAFLEKFNLEHIIRGHQCVQNGYDDKFGDSSIITIFSIPNYVRKHNKGAIMEYIGKDTFEFINIA